MKAVLPENFDLQSHLTMYPPQGVSLKLDQALYLLSQITLVPVRNKSIADEMKDGYTPLCSTKLQEFVHNYKAYFDYFIQTNVIESNNSYETSGPFISGKCKGYRFVRKYEQSDGVEVAYSDEFKKFLVKKRRADYKVLNREYFHLTKWLFRDCQLKIDAETAIKFLEVRRKAQLANPELRDRRKPRGSDFEKLHWSSWSKVKDPEEQYRYGRVGISFIQNGDIGCTVDPKVGRMHTVLTNIKSDLRNLITFGEHPLVSIDIANSQPYLATILFRQNPFATELSRQVIEPILTSLNQPATLNKSNNSLILVKLKELSDSDDFKIYRSLVGNTSTGEYENPGLYEFMKQECDKYGISYATRGEVKEGVFEMLFSKNNRSTKTKKLFKQLFPSVDELFTTIKEGDHARLPILLQRVESHAVLKVITKQIGKKHPKIPIFTIHDSIATPVQYADIVEDIMNRELTKLTGLTPKLRRDYWLPERLAWDKYKT